MQLKAIPFPDSRFAGWKINGMPHEGVITLEEDTVLSAIFERTDDPMLADGVTLYWYDANGGRDYAKIALNQMFIAFEDREKWDVTTDEEYHETLQHIAQTFHLQAEIMSRNRYQMSLKTLEPLEKEQWFEVLSRLQQLTYVQWAGTNTL
ncbi:hypothetical protein CSA56_18045 [candidate division KSB3 bacterium]|uniref:Uncharacterized protein n=1 Tax=candidate division KSB3 bacterium TaxID=2044937 RepID=A0A2G6K7A6_9BACT|nr:MAG: hypothetical protein CSA56_18045 [candidate division KSB3 bacterium]